MTEFSEAVTAGKSRICRPFIAVRPGDPLNIKPITWTGLLGPHTPNCGVEQDPDGCWSIVRSQPICDRAGYSRRVLWSFEAEATCRTAFDLWKNGF